MGANMPTGVLLHLLAAEPHGGIYQLHNYIVARTHSRSEALPSPAVALLGREGDYALVRLNLELL